MSYGYCPKCGEKGISRQRRLNGNDICLSGHIYPSAKSLNSPSDKFITPEPLPTPHERELLIILIEECGEVAQRASKMLRFGVKEVQPKQPHDNAIRLSQEMGDLMAVMQLCVNNNLMDEITIERQVPLKFAKLDKFMQTTPEMKHDH